VCNSTTKPFPWSALLLCGVLALSAYLLLLGALLSVCYAHFASWPLTCGVCGGGVAVVALGLYLFWVRGALRRVRVAWQPLLELLHLVHCIGALVRRLWGVQG
jgi:hypothetical protein